MRAVEALQRGVSLWKEAAELGYSASQFAVASCLFSRSGTIRDVRAALYWCELAIKNGFTDAHVKALLDQIHAELGDAQSLETAVRPRTSGAKSAGAQLLARLAHAIVLGLAQAELRNGNSETARELLKRVQASPQNLCASTRSRE